MIKSRDNHTEAGMCCNVIALLENIEYRVRCGDLPADLTVNSITADSRTAGPGSLFVAMRGDTTDGHRFIEDVRKSGAAAIIVDEHSSNGKVYEDSSLPVLDVQNTKDILSLIAARFYGNPADQMEMIGITGTNGKTTISYLMEHVLCESGHKMGVIGTVEYRYRGEKDETIRYPAPFTTPDPVILHARLKEMADAGVSIVLMEVSSHALQQKRLGPIAFSAGIFTNLSQDHLDYHQSMEAYFEVKCQLFKNHMRPGAVVAVYNPGDENPEKEKWAGKIMTLCDSLGLETIICGNDPAADFRYLNSSFEKTGMSVVFNDSQGIQRLLKSPLVGKFNVENVLVSMGALEAFGLDTDLICESLSTAQGAPGRLQRINLPVEIHDRPLILVDFAHTPDALQNVLETVKTLPHKTLYCVFGCGGDRDRGKRPKMGKIGASLADVGIITDDNPRSEEPAAIRAEVVSGAVLTGRELEENGWLYTRDESEKGCVEIGARGDAIRSAICAADSDDIVVIAGKGHEQYQITRNGKIFFDDCLAARESCLLWDIGSIAGAAEGKIIKDAAVRCLGAVSTDTRTIKKNDIFVALKGESFDGHDFIEKAVNNGAGCVVVSKITGNIRPGVGVVQVADTLIALGDLAARRRKLIGKMNGPVVVGITGSCGKTTVKEMTAAIFQRNWPELADKPSGQVLKTTGNFNNLVGLPLSLLPASARQCGIILEMGMNQPGEISRLTEIADPTIGCITNVCGAHLEGLGSIDGVARAKGELFEGMQEGSVMVINFDDDLVVKNSREHNQPAITYAVTEKGISDHPDVWATDIETDKNGHLSFTLHIRKKQGRVTIYAPGLHNCSNSCAAAAISHAAGIDFDIIAAGLADFRSTPNRMEFLKTPGEINLLNDTYNANPASMASGLETLVALPAQTRVAILGDMLELGAESEKLHEELGRKVSEAGIDYLGVIGDFSNNIVRGAVDSGMPEDRIIVFEDKQSAVDWIAELLHSGCLHRDDWLLVKASRGLALDTVVGQLMQIC